MCDVSRFYKNIDRWSQSIWLRFQDITTFLLLDKQKTILLVFILFYRFWWKQKNRIQLIKICETDADEWENYVFILMIIINVAIFSGLKQQKKKETCTFFPIEIFSHRIKPAFFHQLNGNCQSFWSTIGFHWFVFFFFQKNIFLYLLHTFSVHARCNN